MTAKHQGTKLNILLLLFLKRKMYNKTSEKNEWL